MSIYSFLHNLVYECKHERSINRNNDALNKTKKNQSIKFNLNIKKKKLMGLTMVQGAALLNAPLYV